MLQYTNTVLIGTNCPASYSNEASLAKGDVALFDENKKLLTSTNAAEVAKSIYIGVAADTYQVTDNTGALVTKREIKFSAPIQKGSKPTMVYADYVAPTEDVIEIAFSGSTIEVGHRFVLRLVYGDLYEAPGQFTHTYEVIATTTSTADLAAAFMAKINKHVSRRVDASIDVSTLRLTAKVKDDNEDKESINLYSQVSVDAFVWKTIPNGLLSNVMYPVAGLAITKTQGTPGKGNAKIVRDREQAALGYKGITFRTHWPVIKPELNVNLSSTYDTMVIENWNSYQSPDNQYVKTTPLATDLYVVANELVAGATDSLFKDMVEAFIAKA